jgi:hypothetical protein
MLLSDIPDNIHCNFVLELSITINRLLTFLQLGTNNFSIITLVLIPKNQPSTCKRADWMEFKCRCVFHTSIQFPFYKFLTSSVMVCLSNKDEKESGMMFYLCTNVEKNTELSSYCYGCTGI